MVDEQQHDEPLDKLVHTIRNSLHAFGMGLELLSQMRESKERFEELRDTMEQERKELVKQVDQLIAAARGRDSKRP